MNFTYCPHCGKKDTVVKQDSTNYECSNCQWHFWNNAKGAVAIVFVQDDKLLVSRRGEAPSKGMYDLPGGFANFGEDPYVTALREAKEETGVTVAREDIELIEAYYNQSSDAVSTFDLIFLAHRWSGEFKAGDDCDALEWRPLNFIYDPSFCETHYKGLDIVITKKLAETP
jgi:NAD+ diphosphatase